jgi:hypothetical protein
VPLQPASAQAVVSSTVIAVPLLVQSPSGAGTSSPVAVTLAPTAAGNKLVVVAALAQGSTRPQVSAVTLGGGGSFTLAEKVHSATAADLEIWESTDAAGIAGGQTALSVAFAGGSGTSPGAVVRALEWSGLAVPVALDDAGGTDSSSNTAWTSQGVTAAAAGELFIGAAAAFLSGTPTTLAGAAAPWANLAEVTQGTIVSSMTGWQVLAAAAPSPGAAYTGTLTPARAWTAAGATFIPGVSGAEGNARCTLGPSGLGTVWYPTQVTLSTTTGVRAGFDNSVANLYLGPVIAPNTLLGTVSGGNGIVAAALPPIQPGQFLIAVWTGANGGDTASMNVQGTMDALQ